MNIISFGKTDTGKARKNNEDAYLVDDGRGLYAVADGIGGHEGGEVASRIAVETLAEVFRERREGGLALSSSSLIPAVDPNLFALTDALKLANTKIRQVAAQHANLLHMGTTMTALFLCEKTAYVAHVGDSRVYQLRAGVLTQVTEDHSVTAEQMRAGLLTPEQARTSPYRHIITRALGIDPELPVDQRKITVELHDTFLLCTDGLTEMVEDVEIMRILASASPQEAAESLIRLANERGGVDNITVVVARIEDSR
jgi:protein phosphatase